MKTGISYNQKENWISLLSEIFNKLETASDTLTYTESMHLWHEFHNIYIKKSGSVLQKWADKFTGSELPETIDKIEAGSVVVEVCDENTGRIFRRELPVNYHENDNGIILTGESMDGSPSEITFLSDTAAKKIIDITGRGPDKPHSHE